MINRTLIKPASGRPSLALGEIWAYRELLGMLAWRDISVRYKQSLAGIGWAVFQPLMTMVIFTIVFGKFAKLPSDGLPYPVFAYCALLPWNYFSQSLTGSSDSIVGSSYLITKVYFPRQNAFPPLPVFPLPLPVFIICTLLLIPVGSTIQRLDISTFYLFCVIIIEPCTWNMER
jgi:ABC-type polysaccharide/polyol phosphate export permease